MAMTIVKKKLGLISGVIAIGLVFSTWVFAAEGESDSSEFSLEYPLLQVTPRTSTSLKRYYKEEKRGLRQQYYPIQISALSTLIAGIMVNGDYADDATFTERERVDTASSLSVAVGSAWIGATLLLVPYYKPYKDGFSKIKKLPAADRRQMLTRERLAEEALRGPAKTGFKLRLYSVFSNLLASGLVAATGRENSQVAGGIGALLAFLPLFYDTTYERNSDMQQDFKKRIYGPIAGLIPQISVSGEVDLLPGLRWAMDF